MRKNNIVLVSTLGVLALLANGQDTLLLRSSEGEGAVYSLGSRATRGISVEVTDTTGRPVEGATVAFKLPDQGPTGTFATGLHTEVVTTKADGVASIWGMQWNRIAGEFAVKITAAKGAARAGLIITQNLVAGLSLPEASKNPPQISSGSSHKWVWVVLVAAGGAGAAVAATGFAGKPATLPPPVPTVKLGTPTIILGKP